jgi:hypothetical protein
MEVGRRRYSRPALYEVVKMQNHGRLYKGSLGDMTVLSGTRTIASGLVGKSHQRRQDRWRFWHLPLLQYEFKRAASFGRRSHWYQYQVDQNREDAPHGVQVRLGLAAAWAFPYELVESN